MCCIKRNCEAVYDGFFTVWPPCDVSVPAARSRYIYQRWFKVLAPGAAAVWKQVTGPQQDQQYCVLVLVFGGFSSQVVLLPQRKPNCDWKQ